MYRAACDQVDWVRYLMALEKRLVPSTSSTSPLRSVAAITSRGLVGTWVRLGRGFARNRASRVPMLCRILIPSPAVRIPASILPPTRVQEAAMAVPQGAANARLLRPLRVRPGGRGRIAFAEIVGNQARLAGKVAVVDQHIELGGGEAIKVGAHPRQQVAAQPEAVSVGAGVAFLAQVPVG